MKSELPGGISSQHLDAVVFDLDGVVTQTAKVDATAWKVLFDRYLEKPGGREGRTRESFDPSGDGREFVDGKPRHDGVRSFLNAGDISLPDGMPHDSPEEETICGLGNDGIFFRRRHAAEKSIQAALRSSKTLLPELTPSGMAVLHGLLAWTEW